MIFIIWIILSGLIGSFGSSRKIGFWGAFLLSVFLSPLIGLIACLLSKSNEQVEIDKKQMSILNKISNTKSVGDELLKLKSLKDSGVLNDEEFETEKSKILNHNENLEEKKQPNLISKNKKENLFDNYDIVNILMVVLTIIIICIISLLYVS